MGYKNPGHKNDQPLEKHIRNFITDQGLSTLSGIEEEDEKCELCAGTGLDSERLDIPCLNPCWYSCTRCQGTGRSDNMIRDLAGMRSKLAEVEPSSETLAAVLPFEKKVDHSNDLGKGARMIYVCGHCDNLNFKILENGHLECSKCSTWITLEWFDPNIPPSEAA